MNLFFFSPLLSSVIFVISPVAWTVTGSENWQAPSFAYGCPSPLLLTSTGGEVLTTRSNPLPRKRSHLHLQLECPLRNKAEFICSM